MGFINWLYNRRDKKEVEAAKKRHDRVVEIVNRSQDLVDHMSGKKKTTSKDASKMYGTLSTVPEMDVKEPFETETTQNLEGKVSDTAYDVTQSRGETYTQVVSNPTQSELDEVIQYRNVLIGEIAEFETAISKLDAEKKSLEEKMNKAAQQKDKRGARRLYQKKMIKERLLDEAEIGYLSKTEEMGMIDTYLMNHDPLAQEGQRLQTSVYKKIGENFVSPGRKAMAEASSPVATAKQNHKDAGVSLKSELSDSYTDGFETTYNNAVIAANTQQTGVAYDRQAQVAEIQAAAAAALANQNGE